MWTEPPGDSWAHLTLLRLKTIMELQKTDLMIKKWQELLPEHLSDIPDTPEAALGIGESLAQAFPAPPIDHSTPEMAAWAAEVITSLRQREGAPVIFETDPSVAANAG